MKRKVMKIAVTILAVVMICVFAACSPEIIYYADLTDGKSGSTTTVTPKPGTPTPSSEGEKEQTPTPAVEDTQGDGSTYNLRIWCAEEDVEMINGMLDAYEEKYPKNKYTFTVETQGEDIVSSSVVRDVEAAADVFSFANDQLGVLIKNNALTQIPSVYNEQIENQIDVAKLASRSDGVYYAIPYSYENCFLYYNKSLITNVGTMEDILSANISTVDYNLGIDMSDSYYTTMFLYTAGVNIFGEQGTDPNDVDLDNEAAYKACRYIASLAGKKKMFSISKADQYASLKNGKVAAMISGPHMITQFKQALGDNFAVAMLPKIRFAGDTQDTQLVSFSGVKMYGVSRKSTSARSQKVTDEALKLAAYLANSENQQIRLEDREFCPTDSDLFEAAISSGKNTVEVVVQQSDYSKLKPGLIQMSNYWENMKGFLLGVYKLSYGEGKWSEELKKVEAKLKG